MSQREINPSTDLPLQACLLEDGSNFPDVLEGSGFIQGPAHRVLCILAKTSFPCTEDACVRQPSRLA